MALRFEYEWDEFQTVTAEHARKARLVIGQRAAAGWRVHTCDFSSHPYFQILWEREVSVIAVRDSEGEHQQ
jgi:hypothetical protein